MLAVGAELAARAQLARCRRLLQHRHAHADARPRQRDRQAADAAAHDEDRRGIGGPLLHWRTGWQTRLLWHGRRRTATRSRGPGVRGMGVVALAPPRIRVAARGHCGNGEYLPPAGLAQVSA